MSDTEQQFTSDVIESMRIAIHEANGNEVFFAGLIDRNGLVHSAPVAARGNESAVLVIRSAAETADVLIHNHPSGNLTPSDADLDIAARASLSGTGFYIINNAVTSVYVVVEAVPAIEKTPLDPTEIAGLLDETGPLALSSVNYETRQSQMELAASVTHAFNEGSIGVFEAGTGVGKSYAYLLPAIAWAVQNHDRVVISTGTINLQQQLAEKDIPAACAIVGKQIKFVLMKGRQNYVCRRRLAEVLQDRELFDDDASELEKISAWTGVTAEGSKSDLSFMPKEAVWSRICSESDACMGMRCAFHESCFVMRVRKEAAAASIIVVNHHLLFADLEARMGGAGYEDTAVLPPFHHIVFDEAHAMEDAATSFFSEYFTRFKLQKQINILYRVRRGSIGGHLIALERLSDAGGEVQNALAVIQDIRDSLSRSEEAALSLCGEDFSFRLCDRFCSRFDSLLECLSSLRSAIATFAGIIRKVLEGISEEDQSETVVWESKFVLRRLENVGTLCLHFTEWTERRESVFWIEKQKTRDGAVFPRFVQTPLSGAAMMKEGVFEPFNTVICTSATLRIGGHFHYWLHRTGVTLMEEDRVKSAVFDSPFPYRSNVLFSVPSDAPLPDESGYQSWIETAIVSLLQASAGHSLVLFTSYESLRLACAVARNALAPLGITVLKQGDDDRGRLLEAFKNDESSVLFATDSFWEGVDAPGNALLHVIIVKLPFRVPNDPVHAARSEAIELKGGNPFMELSLPEAVIRFRQGFGRLMRRNTDRGAVTVLDRRLLVKKYGSVFLASIPETATCFESLDRAVDRIERFIYRS